MYQINAYLKDSIGEKQTDFVKLEQKPQGDVIAVFIKGYVKGFTKTLDADFGAGIEIPLPNVSSWMANFRYCEYWCKPRFGKALADIPDETQGLIYQKEDGTFGVILPVVSNQYKCVLCGRKDTVLAKLFSWYKGINRIDTLAFVYAEGDNPYELLENCAKRAAELLNNGLRTVEERRYPEIFEYLGWCSWDAFEIRVTEQDLVNKCEEFKSKNVPVRWTIIDDMWGEVRDFYDMEYSKREEMFELMHAAKLYSFQADPYRFPNGLKHCISKIKDYGITVGMWHPTTGYWRGIDPEGDIYIESCMTRNKKWGYIRNIEIEDVYAEDVYTAVRILSVESEISNISFKNLHCGVREYGLNLDAGRYCTDPLFDDVDYPYGVGNVHDIYFENVTLYKTIKSGRPICTFEQNAKKFVFKNFRFIDNQFHELGKPAFEFKHISDTDLKVDGNTQKIKLQTPYELYGTDFECIEINSSYLFSK